MKNHILKLMNDYPYVITPIDFLKIKKLYNTKNFLRIYKAIPHNHNIEFLRNKYNTQKSIILDIIYYYHHSIFKLHLAERVSLGKSEIHIDTEDIPTDFKLDIPEPLTNVSEKNRIIEKYNNWKPKLELPKYKYSQVKKELCQQSE